MTRRLSMDGAVELLEGELGSGQRALDDLVTEDVWLAFLRFGRRLFDVPDTPDADGLLFQYGIHAFDGPPAFTVDLTRQFAVSDSNGDHDHYVQVHCEPRYAVVQELAERPVWATIQRLKPAEIRVYQEPA
ncbi:hypothetical protein [Streptomyces sp. PanSC9]|uniref:hypothetical protein n=1 Tax=Streptomyces sp. PanSC9 TaxID=1520461 RepID=UPI000FA10B07|nr:hypothetical protein [Streptomyces sp. PanSC9]ROP55937.1 hypothetical protein EDD94_5516 [Streptomyces sp. PanSC9]